MGARSRRGVALFAALALTAVIGLLAAGGVAFTRLSQRTWRDAFVDASLTRGADYALATVLADAHRLSLAELPLGQTVTTSVAVPGAVPLSAVVGVTRLPSALLWIVAEVTEGGGAGRRRFNLVARYPSLGQHLPGAITSRGNVSIANDVVFAPADTSQDPECAGRGFAGVVVPAGVATDGVDSARVITSAAATDSAAYLLTSRQLALLHSTGRFTHVRGDTVIASGAFDGVLIVDGALTIAGSFNATGLIVVRGPIAISGGVTTITGAVMSFAPPVAEKLAIKFSGVTVRYSPCAVDRAIRSALEPQAISLRSWAEIF